MKKISFFLLSFLALLLFTAFPVLAKVEQESVVLNSNEIIESDYFAGSDTVQVSGTVNGDAYVAGKTVLVDGTINGDLLTGGGNVTISGNIAGDVRVGGGNVTFAGATVGGNITAAGGNVTLDQATVLTGSLVAVGGNIQVFSPVGKGASFGAGSVLIANTVGGDIRAGVGELSLSAKASVNGNLTYWSEEKARIAQGATVSGIVKQNNPPVEKIDTRKAGEAAKAAVAGILLGLKIADIIWLLIVGFALLYFFPNFAEKTQFNIRKKLGNSLLVGLITLIVVPAVGIFLLITLFGIPLAISLFFIFFILIWLGRIFALYAFGRSIMQKTGNKNAVYTAYIVGVLVYLVLSVIPVVNFVTEIFITLSGSGGLLLMKKTYYTDLRIKKII